MRVPIVRGVLRGCWWEVGSGGKLLRVALGTYEPEHAALFGRVLGAGQRVYDVGAHTGYYTLMASRRVGPQGRVVAFEPNPRNAGYLRANLRLNGCANVEVVEAAVSDGAGAASFAPGRGSGTGRLAAAGELTVSTVRLDDFVQGAETAPTVIKVDVEGAEAAVLAGALSTLRQSRPLLFLSLHGEAERARCTALLEGVGYRFRPIGAARSGGSAGAGEEVFCFPGELGESGAYQSHGGA